MYSLKLINTLGAITGEKFSWKKHVAQWVKGSASVLNKHYGVALETVYQSLLVLHYITR